MAVSVRLLKAKHGDCILVSHTEDNVTFNLLIDGGPPSTFKHGPRHMRKGDLCSVLDEIKFKNQIIDLVILTHVDHDHIGGLIRAFKAPGYLQDLVKSVWFNASKNITDYFDHPEILENNIQLSDGSPETSPSQGKNLEALLQEIKCQKKPIIIAGQVLEEGPFRFTILSPTDKGLKKLLRVWPKEKKPAETSPKEKDHNLSFNEILSEDQFSRDTSDTNESSIAFILEVAGRSMLFLGDAHDKTIISSLQSLGYSSEKPLNVDMVKVSHHGSKGNTSVEFLEMINTSRFLISTDGSHHGLPDKRTIARILASNDEGIVYFNYDSVINSLLKVEDKELFLSRLHMASTDIHI